MVPYMSSIYGVAPDFICDFPEDIEEPIDIDKLGAHIEKLMKPIGTYGVLTFDGFDIEFKVCTKEREKKTLQFRRFFGGSFFLKPILSL